VEGTTLNAFLPELMSDAGHSSVACLKMGLIADEQLCCEPVLALEILQLVVTVLVVSDHDTICYKRQ